MLEKISNYMASHETAAYRAQFVDFTLRVSIGADTQDLRFAPGGVTVEPQQGEADLCFEFSEQDFAHFVAADAPVGYQSLTSMAETGKLRMQGQLEHYFRHILFLEGAFQSLRNKTVPAPQAFDEAGVEPIVGRYLRLNLDGVGHRVYFEEAGQGIPLLCLHTAGADGRQYRELLNCEAVTSRFRVIVFDLPWHGKSSPPAGFQQHIYQLTTDKYVSTVMAVKQALGLEQPVVMGCSIGGRAVLHLALRHGDEFRAAIGLQSATHAESVFGGELNDMYPLWRADMHGSEVAGGMMEMLIAPQSPDHHKWETLWHYMQGGPGVFVGDIHYYMVDGDMRNGIAEQIDTQRCPLYLLTGEYDVSATPQMTAELAEQVNAQYFKVMKGVGHFPMSENPEQFLSYLQPVLAQVEAQAA